MATEAEARVQLSKDLGDYFASTATANGAAGGTTIVDATLADWDADSFFLQRRRTMVYHVDDDEERRADESVGLTGSPIDTLTLTRGFSAQVATDDNYEVHKLFSVAQKIDAINQAVDLIWPRLFLPAETTITTVANQMDYDVSAAGFFNNVVRDVRVESTADTEHWVRVFNWELRHDDTSGTLKLHFYDPPVEARTVHIFGHKKMALSDYTDKENLLALSAQAAIFILEQELMSGHFVDDRSLLERLYQLNRNRLEERIRKYKRQSIPFTVPSQMTGRRQFNIFDVP